jgi:hypothetical protein
MLGLAILATGRVQFGGADGGLLADAAWQLHLGYKPYTDLVTAVPPLFLAGAWLAFKLFGVHWLAFIGITAVFAVLTFCLHVPLLMRAGLRPGVAIALATLTQLCTSLPSGYWWYNFTTQVVACLFFSAVAGWRRQAYLDAAVTILGMLLLLSKPNVALTLLCLVLPYLLVRQGWRRTIVTYSCIGLIALLTLRLFHVPVRPMLWNYGVASSRASDLYAISRFLIFNQFWEVQQTFFILIPGAIGMLILLGSSIPWRSTPRALAPLGNGLALMAIGVITSLVAAATNNSFNFTELPLALSGVAFFLVLSWDVLRPKRVRKLAMVSTAFTGICLAANAIRIAATRLAILEVGANEFYQNAPLTTITAPSFFAGVQGSPALFQVSRDLDATLSSCPWCTERTGAVFIGPRIDFAYAAYGLTPHRGIPLWWEPFNDPAEPATRAMVDRFTQAHFLLAVFLRDDYTFLPASQIDYLKKEYDVTNTQTLTIYRAKTYK